MTAVATTGGSATLRPGPVVGLTDVAFGYDDRPVVSGVTLEIRAGERVAVLGANGSGKSTLVKGVLGLNQRMAGEVELFGHPAGRSRDRRWIGYVPQRQAPPSVVATVDEVVTTGRLLQRPWYARQNRGDRAAVARSLDTVDLAEMARRPVGTLSGGQLRRVLIARVLAGEPRLLILDEPTAGVDAAAQQALARTLGRIAAQGATIVVVTHDLDAFGPLFTRVVVMSGGRIAADQPAGPVAGQGPPEVGDVARDSAV